MEIRRAGRRRSNRKLLGSAVAGLAVTATAAVASPWPRDDGRIFVSMRGAYFRAIADETIAPASEPAQFERFDSDTYAEFGLTDSITLGGKVLYGTATHFDGAVSASASGFSEIEAFVQTRLHYGDRGSLSVKLSGAAPSRFEAGARPGLVNDGADVEIRALYGRNLILSPLKVFATTEAGYRRRFGGAADQIRLDALVGAEPTKRLMVLFEAFSTISLRNARPGGADYDVVKLRPSLVWRLSSRIAVQAGLTREITGRNLLLGDAYFVGLWTVF